MERPDPVDIALENDKVQAVIWGIIAGAVAFPVALLIIDLFMWGF